MPLDFTAFSSCVLQQRRRSDDEDPPPVPSTHPPGTPPADRPDGVAPSHPLLHWLRGRSSTRPPESQGGDTRRSRQHSNSRQRLSSHQSSGAAAFDVRSQSARRPAARTGREGTPQSGDDVTWTTSGANRRIVANARFGRFLLAQFDALLRDVPPHWPARRRGNFLVATPTRGIWLELELDWDDAQRRRVHTVTARDGEGGPALHRYRSHDQAALAQLPLSALIGRKNHDICFGPDGAATGVCFVAARDIAPAAADDGADAGAETAATFAPRALLAATYNLAPEFERLRDAVRDGRVSRRQLREILGQQPDGMSLLARPLHYGWSRTVEAIGELLALLPPAQRAPLIVGAWPNGDSSLADRARGRGLLQRSLIDWQHYLLQRVPAADRAGLLAGRDAAGRTCLQIALRHGNAAFIRCWGRLLDEVAPEERLELLDDLRFRGRSMLLEAWDEGRHEAIEAWKSVLRRHRLKPADTADGRSLEVKEWGQRICLSFTDLDFA